jgi:hypothetical protein
MHDAPLFQEDGAARFWKTPAIVTSIYTIRGL